MRTDLVTQGVNRLLDAIIAGEFAPGEALPNESNLAQYLEVSRPTMREVVRTLAERGVVQVVHGRGTFVCPQSEWIDVQTLIYAISQQLDKRQVGAYLTQLRRMLEVGSAGIAAEKITYAELAEVQETVDTYRQATDPEEVTRADVAFHTKILEATGNPFIKAVILPLQDALSNSRLITNSYPDTRARALHHHETILQALYDHDPQAAKDAMRAHMTQTLEDINSHIPGSPTPVSPNED